MSSNQLWGPEEDIPDLISDDSEEEEALVARAPRQYFSMQYKHLPRYMYTVAVFNLHHVHTMHHDCEQLMLHMPTGSYRQLC